jgi:hypothetical protein
LSRDRSRFFVGDRGKAPERGGISKTGETSSDCNRLIAPSATAIGRAGVKKLGLPADRSREARLYGERWRVAAGDLDFGEFDLSHAAGDGGRCDRLFFLGADVDKAGLEAAIPANIGAGRRKPARSAAVLGRRRSQISASSSRTLLLGSRSYRDQGGAP